MERGRQQNDSLADGCAKGGMQLEDASLSIFDAEEDGKRAHQFFLTGKTTDGSYAGSRDLVMCATSDKEFQEWKQVFQGLITDVSTDKELDNPASTSPANTSAPPEPEAEPDPDDDAVSFLVSVQLSTAPAAAAHTLECGAKTTAADVIDSYFASCGQNLAAAAPRQHAVLQRHALGEVLYEGDPLVHYDFVRLELQTHDRPTLPLTILFKPAVVAAAAAAAGDAAAAAAGDRVESVNADVRNVMDELNWLRNWKLEEPAHEHGADELAEAIADQPHLVEIVADLQRDPLKDVPVSQRTEFWRNRLLFAKVTSPGLQLQSLWRIPTEAVS